MNLFANHDTSKDISINDITVQTGIKTEDIISTLQSLDMIEVWKGQHVVHVKQAVVREYMEQEYVAYKFRRLFCVLRSCKLTTHQIYSSL